MDNEVERVIEAVWRGWRDELGDAATGLFLYGSAAKGCYQAGESDVNLLVIVADETAGAERYRLIHRLRQSFYPLWQKERAVLRRAPLVVAQGELARWLAVNPPLAHRLAQEGRWLHGRQEWPTPDPQESARLQLAHLAAQARQAAGALTPELLSPAEADAATRQCRRLARQLFGRPIPAGETATSLLAGIHDRLEQMAQELDLPDPRREQQIAGSPPLLPELQAIYERGETVILLLSHLSGRKILETDWPAVGRRLQKEYSAIEVSALRLFQLSAALDDPLGVVLGQYRHVWGLDPLAELEIAPGRIFRAAARIPLAIYTEELPNACLTSPLNEEALHKIIHDYQNRLMNVRLRHELLRRLYGVEAVEPPDPLPGRPASPAERISALYQHLDWWSDHYYRLTTAS